MNPLIAILLVIAGIAIITVVFGKLFLSSSIEAHIQAIEQTFRNELLKLEALFAKKAAATAPSPVLTAAQIAANANLAAAEQQLAAANAITTLPEESGVSSTPDVIANYKAQQVAAAQAAVTAAQAAVAAANAAAGKS